MSEHYKRAKTVFKRSDDVHALIQKVIIIKKYAAKIVRGQLFSLKVAIVTTYGTKIA